MGSKPFLFDGTGKVVVVVGGANGIGRATVDLCVDAGADVVCADIVAIEESPKLLAFVGDISQQPTADALAHATVDRFGRIDAVVNCVGIAGQGPIDVVELDNWNRVMAVNLTASLFIAQAFHAHLKASSGSLVLFGSTAAKTGGTVGSGAVYAASKAAVLSLSRYLAKEWATDGIRVNTVSPAMVRTGPSNAMSSDRIDRFLETMLTGRFIEPEEIAAAVLFLISDHGRSMTGTVMNVSGGLVLD